MLETYKKKYGNVWEGLITGYGVINSEKKIIFFSDSKSDVYDFAIKKGKETKEDLFLFHIKNSQFVKWNSK